MGPSQEQGLRLLLAIDASFEPLAAVAVYSFLLHNQWQSIVVVTPETTQLHQLPKLAARFETTLLQLTIPPAAPCHQLPQAVKPYFYCIEAIEQTCHGALAAEPGRYLYVDADTLCMRNLSELERLPLSIERPLAACSHGRPMIDRQLVLELETPYHYFNAGVLLFESELLSSLFHSQEVVEFYLNNQAICRFREQCALNSLLRDKIRFMPNQYNYLSWMRPRVAGGQWHQISANPMAYCLEHVREELAIAHLSAGAIPSRLSPERREAVDIYWLELAEQLSKM
jgi:lipopolysaccharide biosynthesis glycosyltransferase